MSHFIQASSPLLTVPLGTDWSHSSNYIWDTLRLSGSLECEHRVMTSNEGPSDNDQIRAGKEKSLRAPFYHSTCHAPCWLNL